jgi:ubiquinone/menaquinone biosynthesis C-methylase UbiE
MGFYQRWIMPRLIDLAMRNHRLTAYRLRTIGNAHGFALEIGVGSGQNLLPYGSAVDHVCAIDPSAQLLRLARNRMADVSVPVSLVRGSTEKIPFADAIFDTVASGPSPNFGRAVAIAPKVRHLHIYPVDIQ